MEHPHLNNTSYKGKIRLRKKKYKTKKYKNSQWRIGVEKKRERREKKKRKKKALKKETTFNEKAYLAPIEKCKHCQLTSEVDNIFKNPLERHSCDFCNKCFDGIRLDYNICNYCLNLVYRCNFCSECIQNLGEWDINWRMKLKIPPKYHPSR